MVGSKIYLPVSGNASSKPTCRATKVAEELRECWTLLVIPFHPFSHVAHHLGLWGSPLFRLRFPAVPPSALFLIFGPSSLSHTESVSPLPVLFSAWSAPELDFVYMEGWRHRFATHI